MKNAQRIENTTDKISTNIANIITTIVPISHEENYSIPSWIKNSAKWWSQGQIDDSEFVKGMQYLIQQGIIQIPQTSSISSSSNVIPGWVKNNAGWWASGKISDDDFVKGIQYLVKSGIITIKPNYSLTFFLKFESPQYKTNLEILAKNLKQGDYMLIDSSPPRAPDLLEQVQEARSLVDPGVHVISVIDYRSITNLTATVPTLPKGIDYIMYDYEGGSAFSPEFTTDEKMSISYFDKARTAVQQYNKNTGSNAKLFVTPPYGQLRKANWDWELAANHMDVIDMQLQIYLKDPNMKSYATNIIEQIKKGSPGKLVFIQLSINPKRGTLQDNVNAIDSLKNVDGINAFLIYYLPYQSSDLTQFFSLLNR